MSTTTITRPKSADPAILDEDMTARDIVDALEMIQFPKGRPGPRRAR